MGISVGIGMAVTAKRDGKGHRVFVLLGDGECNEGSVWEGFMAASQYGLDNLTVIVDYNDMQFDGRNSEIMSLDPLAEKMRAFGFSVQEVNGHDLGALKRAFLAENEGRPKAVIAHTIKANGVRRLEDRPESHQTVITYEDYADAISGREAGNGKF